MQVRKPSAVNLQQMINDFINHTEIMSAKSMLNAWIKNAISSNVKEIKGFAKGLHSDFEAIENGIKLPWSNGPVEGLVNKLKIIKRQMYGRASFELLRKRLVNHQA